MVFSCFQTSVYQTGQAENSTSPRLGFEPANFVFLERCSTSELQGQAENDLLSYDVSCISEVSTSMRKASY